MLAALGNPVRRVPVPPPSGGNGGSAANIASHNFEDGTAGPFTDFGVAAITYPADPTGSGRGKVARFHYAPPFTGGVSSNDVNIVLDTAHHFKYGETIWFKGDVFYPSTTVDGTPQTTAQKNDNRKTIDWLPAFNNGAPRLLLHRHLDVLVYFIGQIEDDGNYHEDITIGNTGIPFVADTWYTVEAMYKMNSANGVKDGVLDVYLNNSSATPSFHLATGLFPISDGLNGGTTAQQNAFNAGGSYFSSFRFGTQLSIFTNVDPIYEEYRYWDNVGYSTTRIA